MKKLTLDFELSAKQERELLDEAAALASAKAVRENKALGLPTQVIIDGKVYERAPDGSLTFICNY